jgi:hypothetical protein
MATATRFRLLCGKHHEGDANGAQRTYVRGDVFDSPYNLLKFNSLESKRFEVVPDSTPLVHNEVKKPPAEPNLETPQAGPATENTLDSMTVTELRTLAEEEEIDLGNASRKDQIIQAIRATR